MGSFLFSRGTASFSADGKYRWNLTRPIGAGSGRTVFILLNPSTATAEEDDPTICRCTGYARFFGHAELEVVNIFAMRATDPKKLYQDEDPVGPENDKNILAAVERADIVVAAWGVHGKLRHRQEQVLELLKDVKIFCLEKTKFGFPKHPLYLKVGLKPIPFRRTGS